MKKIITFLFSAFIFTSFAQIPNFSFENWTSMGSYEVPNGWGTMNNSTATFSVYTATKATPGNPGNFYMKLTSKTVGTVVANGIAVSGQIDSTTMQPKSGFPYTQRPANFTGKWQHMIYGTSQGSLYVKLTRWDTGLNQRVTVGTASVTLSGMAMSWANFSLPFTYADGGYPDTCIIILKASGASPTNNDYLWVDNLAFSGTVAGINNLTSAISDLNVFPNPTHNKISIKLNFGSLQNTSISLVDFTGKTIRSKSLGTVSGEVNESIDISGVAPGTYFIRITSGNSSETRKVVIE